MDRRVVLGATLVLLAFGASALMTASSVQRAAAACTGPGQPLIIARYDTNGNALAVEAAPYPGSTCNNDFVYSGLVLDPVTDGSCAYVYHLEPLAYYAQQGVSCTTGVWNGFGYTDSFGPNNVFVSVRPSYLADNWVLSSGY